MICLLMSYFKGYQHALVDLLNRNQKGYWNWSYGLLSVL